MDQAELKEYLKNNLSLDISAVWGDFQGKRIKVTLKLDNTIIASDYIAVEDIREDY